MDLDQPCSRHFRFRELIQCGQTWERLASEPGQLPFNVPQQAETWDAIERLCRDVLDPVVDAFGPVVLTYGFSSRALHKHITRAIAPGIDQHAGHELNARGEPICKRLGMAADLRVPGMDSLDLARWIAHNTHFDRLYVYEPTAPIHVSAGPEESRLIVEMMEDHNGHRRPRRTTRGPDW